MASAVFASVAAAAAASTLDRSPESAFYDIGGYGAEAVARALAGFGLGLFLGAYFGRAMPALVLTSVILGLLVLISVEARHRWLFSQEPVIAGAGMEEVLVTGAPGRVDAVLDVDRCQFYSDAAKACVVPGIRPAEAAMAGRDELLV
jgi:hypothetical protein